MENEQQPKQKNSKRIWLVVLILALCLVVFAGYMFVKELMPYVNSQSEYDALRQSFAAGGQSGGEPQTQPPSATPPQTQSPDAAPTQSPSPSPAVLPEPSPSPSPTAEPTPTPRPKDPAEINEDYVGWILCDMAKVDYPVVQGDDNDEYLYTTFAGKENKLGAIFLDSRCGQGLDSAHVVIYGHNAKNGTMFGSLKRLLGKEGSYPNISITKDDGTTATYAVFSVRLTDAYDPAYRLDFADDDMFAAFASDLGAPEGTTNLLTLSTCTDSAEPIERLLVHAALIQ